MKHPFRMALRRPRRYRHDFRWVGLAALLLSASMLIVVAICFFLPYQGPSAVLALGTRLPASRLYDRSGTHLLEIFESATASESHWFSPGRGDCAADAFRAAERDSSLRPLAPPLRAMFASLTDGSDPAAEAAAELSTLFGADVSAWDKARLASTLATRYSSDTLVEWLLNTRLYGRRAVGVDDAARTYFHVSAQTLQPPQCATLEALARNPDLAATLPDLASARDVILRRMAEQGTISGDVYASNAGLAAWIASPVDNGSPFLRAYLGEAESRLEKVFPGDEPARAGLRVITTLDLDFLQQALCSAQTLLQRSDGTPVETSPPMLAGEPCSAAALLGPLPAGGRAMDFAFAAIDPESGELLAYVDSARGERLVSDGVAGTATIPFVYLAGFAHGITPAEMLLDIPSAGALEKGEGPITARFALQQRRMAATAEMTARVGEDSVARTMALLGLPSLILKSVPASDWTKAPLTPFALARGFAIVAASGLQIEDGLGESTIVIRRVEHMDGGAIGSFSSREIRRVVGAELSYLLQDILSDPAWIQALPGPGLDGVESSTGAALGETVANGDSWASLLSPQLVMSVRATPLSHAHADPAFPWAVAQSSAGWRLRVTSAQVWRTPDGIRRQEICLPSGMLPSADCPSRSMEVFISGTEPIQPDTYYRPVAINEESGLRATLWTSPGLIERKIFFFLPPEAAGWAKESGFAEPPEAYDALPAAFPCFPELCIQSPSPFAMVRGVVAIQGVAMVKNMSNYLLQAGPGLYPSAWYVLAKGDTADLNMALAAWDTAGKDGIWSLELIALQPDGSVRQSSLPVMVDNIPPTLRWRLPEGSTPIRMRMGSAMIAQVDAADNLEMDYVEFVVDGKSIDRSQVAPFSVNLNSLTVGRHTLQARCADRAGNQTASSVMEVEVGN
jgi:hypothetical protein